MLFENKYLLNMVLLADWMVSQVKPNRAFNDARASLHAWRASATFVRDGHE